MARRVTIDDGQRNRSNFAVDSRSRGHKRECAGCHEPTEQAEKLGKVWLCTSCMTKIKERARRSKEPARSTENMHALMYNVERKPFGGTPATRSGQVGTWRSTEDGDPQEKE